MQNTAVIKLRDRNRLNRKVLSALKHLFFDTTILENLKTSFEILINDVFSFVQKSSFCQTRILKPLTRLHTVADYNLVKNYESFREMHALWFSFTKLETIIVAVLLCTLLIFCCCGRSIVVMLLERIVVNVKVANVQRKSEQAF